MSGLSQYDDISPKYIMELVPKVENALWDMFDTSKYRNVKQYILKWHRENDSYNYNDYWENFHVYYQGEDSGTIDLSETLHRMPNDVLINIAIDLGIDTPGFLPSIPSFKNILLESNQNAFQQFGRAIKNVNENPDDAVSLANATLESVIKTILSHEEFNDIEYNTHDTLYDLTQTILKRFKIFPDKKQELKEIQAIASSLLKVSQNVEALRSDKTSSHGKAHKDYVIDDPLWANLIVNVVATVGMFILQYYETRFAPQSNKKEGDTNEPIDLKDIPF